MFFRKKKIAVMQQQTTLSDLQLTAEQYEVIEKVKKYVLNIWKLGNLHGLPHWENVAKNGLMLAKHIDANPFITQLFAYLHDSCRINDGADLEHGIRASDLVMDLKHTLLKDLTSKELEQLYLACRHHTTALRLEDKTINTCFDADRLDLTRLYYSLNPNRMATEIGAHLAQNL
jgi:uncharacterized protein